jgi:hypothetical protein
MGLFLPDYPPHAGAWKTLGGMLSLSVMETAWPKVCQLPFPPFDPSWQLAWAIEECCRTSGVQPCNSFGHGYTYRWLKRHCPSGNRISIPRTNLPTPPTYHGEGTLLTNRRSSPSIVLSRKRQRRRHTTVSFTGRCSQLHCIVRYQ